MIHTVPTCVMAAGGRGGGRSSAEGRLGLVKVIEALAATAGCPTGPVELPVPRPRRRAGQPAVGATRETGTEREGEKGVRLQFIFLFNHINPIPSSLLAIPPANQHSGSLTHSSVFILIRAKVCTLIRV